MALKQNQFVKKSSVRNCYPKEPHKTQELNLELHFLALLQLLL